MRLLDTFISDAGIATSLRKGAAIITATVHAKNHNDFTTVTPKEKVVSWWSLDVTHFIEPIACNANSVHQSTISGADLECDNLCYFGGYFLGDFEELDLPVVDFTVVDTLLCDVMATMWALIVNDEYSVAATYLQAAYMMIATSREILYDMPDGSANIAELTPYEL